MGVMNIILPFLAGVLSFVSPCIIPMIAVYFSTITGMTLDDLSDKIKFKNLRKHVVINTLIFIFSFTLVFTFAGALSGEIGKVIFGILKYMNIVGGILIILLGLSTLGILKIGYKKFIDWDLKSINQKYRYLGTFLIGVSFAVVCSHCIGPILYSMIIYAGLSKNAIIGALIMFSFSIGLGLMYFLTGLILPQILEYLNKNKKVLRIFTIILGFIVITLGIMVISGKFQLLTQWLYKLVPFKLPIGM